MSSNSMQPQQVLCLLESFPAKRIAEENERQRLVALRKTEEEEKRAREKVLKKLEADKLEQKQALGLPLENQAAKPRRPIAQKEEKFCVPFKLY